MLIPHVLKGVLTGGGGWASLHPSERLLALKRETERVQWDYRRLRDPSLKGWEPGAAPRAAPGRGSTRAPGIDPAVLHFLRGWAARDGKAPSGAGDCLALAEGVINGSARAFKGDHWFSGSPELLGVLDLLVRSLRALWGHGGGGGEGAGSDTGGAGGLSVGLGEDFEELALFALVGALEALGRRPWPEGTPPADLAGGGALRAVGLDPGEAPGRSPKGTSVPDVLWNDGAMMAALALRGSVGAAIALLSGFYDDSPSKGPYQGALAAIRGLLDGRGEAWLLWRLKSLCAFGRAPGSRDGLGKALGLGGDAGESQLREIILSLSAILCEARHAFACSLARLANGPGLSEPDFLGERDGLLRDIAAKYSPKGLWGTPPDERVWPLKEWGGKFSLNFFLNYEDGSGSFEWFRPEDSFEAILVPLRHIPLGDGRG
jgi:hypothetical protein